MISLLVAVYFLDALALLSLQEACSVVVVEISGGHSGFADYEMLSYRHRIPVPGTPLGCPIRAECGALAKLHWPSFVHSHPSPPVFLLCLLATFTLLLPDIQSAFSPAHVSVPLPNILYSSSP